MAGPTETSERVLSADVELFLGCPRATVLLHSPKIIAFGLAAALAIVLHSLNQIAV